MSTGGTILARSSHVTAEINAGTPLPHARRLVHFAVRAEDVRYEPPPIVVAPAKDERRLVWQFHFPCAVEASQNILPH